MMKRCVAGLFVCSILIVILTGCAVEHQAIPPFHVQQIPSVGYQPRVDNFLVLLDASSSMDMRHHGRSKFDIAKDLVYHLNQTVPVLGIKGGLLSFGHSPSISREKTLMGYGMTAYSGPDMSAALDKITRAGGSSPMNFALDAGSAGLETSIGEIAVMLISDGEDLGDEPLKAAERMKRAYGDRLCLYAIQVGDDPAGGELMQNIAKAIGCTDAVNADDLATGPQMAAFATTVFVGAVMDADGDGVADAKDNCPGTPAAIDVDATGCPMDFDQDGVPDFADKCPGTPVRVAVSDSGCPMDADRDGVPDHLDQCPRTPAGVSVNSIGCPLVAAGGEVTAAGTWLYRDINFESNKSELMTSSYPTLNEIADYLRNNPDVKMEIQGHTDSMGNRNYNLMLSKERAAAVRAYLTHMGIPSYQLSAKGYGPDLPIASNKTAEGRSRNRRVELRPMQ